MLILDDQWTRIDDEFDNNGERTIPRFARMVRTQGGMIVGRVIRQADKFQAQKWGGGQFASVGIDFDSADAAHRALEQV
jgi:hypothetical protein